MLFLLVALCVSLWILFILVLVYLLVCSFSIVLLGCCWFSCWYDDFYLKKMCKLCICSWMSWQLRGGNVIQITSRLSCGCPWIWIFLGLVSSFVLIRIGAIYYYWTWYLLSWVYSHHLWYLFDGYRSYCCHLFVVSFVQVGSQCLFSWFLESRELLIMLSICSWVNDFFYWLLISFYSILVGELILTLS